MYRVEGNEEGHDVVLLPDLQHSRMESDSTWVARLSMRWDGVVRVFGGERGVGWGVGSGD